MDHIPQTAETLPLFAIRLVELHKAGRIDKRMLVEALNDPKQARFLVFHELMHDLMELEIFMEKAS